jgi:hypothetical protein
MPTTLTRPDSLSDTKASTYTSVDVAHVVHTTVESSPRLDGEAWEWTVRAEEEVIGPEFVLEIKFSSTDDSERVRGLHLADGRWRLLGAMVGDVRALARALTLTADAFDVHRGITTA